MVKRLFDPNWDDETLVEKFETWVSKLCYADEKTAEDVASNMVREIKAELLKRLRGC